MSKATNDQKWIKRLLQTLRFYIMTKAQHIYQYEIRYCLTSKPTLTIRCHNPNNCTLYQFPHEFQRKVSMEIEKCPWSHFYTNFTRIKIIMISVYIGKTKHLLARQYEHLRTSIFTDRALKYNKADATAIQQHHHQHQHNRHLHNFKVLGNAVNIFQLQLKEFLLILKMKTSLNIAKKINAIILFWQIFKCFYKHVVLMYGCIFVVCIAVKYYCLKMWNSCSRKILHNDKKNISFHCHFPCYLIHFLPISTYR